MRNIWIACLSSLALSGTAVAESTLDAAPISGTAGVALNATPIIGVNDPGAVIELRASPDGAAVEATLDRIDGDRLVRVTPAELLAPNTAYDLVDGATVLATFTTGDALDEVAPGPVVDLRGCADTLVDGDELLSLSWSFGEDGWFEIDLDGPDGAAAPRVQLGNAALLLPDDPSWTGDGLKPAVRLVDIAGNAGPWTDLDLPGPVVRCVTAPSGCATVGAGPWWGMLAAAALIRRIARR